MKQRVITALLLAPLVLVAVFCASAIPIGLLLAVVVIVGTSEVARLVGSPLAWAGLFIYALAATGTAVVFSPQSIPFALMGTGTFLLGIAACSTWFSGVKGAAVFASGWLIGPCLNVFYLHQLQPRNELWNWASPVLLAIVPLWAGDTAAIFAGKRWGKHKLAPTISPNKTIEGATANLLACVSTAILFGFATSAGPWLGAGAGVLCGILGQCGDLFESSVKRRAGLKDSGTLLPGHGGILDRIDSVLFSTPAVTILVLVTQSIRK